MNAPVAGFGRNAPTHELRPARSPRAAPLRERLLVLDKARGSIQDARLSELPTLLAPGDLIVVNDAATLPASLHAKNRALELRLVQRLDSDLRWRAVLFGAGDWRMPTEARPPPPPVRVGERIELGERLSARIDRIAEHEPRLVDLSFDRDGVRLFRALYELGRPIQYSYLRDPLALWDVQSRFAARPWAVEPPSASLPLSFGLIVELKRRGIGLAFVTHAAGISSTGSETLDRKLPLPERYEVGDAACESIAVTRKTGGRVIAAGTTVVRALESAAQKSGAELEPSIGEATLRIARGFQPRVVDGVLTGMHAPGTSHFSLLEAFADGALLERAHAEAVRLGYLGHEFGDACLVL
jgi:S-adenosylmethionine:tRNA ribosyltransferase-isomerase